MSIKFNSIEYIFPTNNINKSMNHTDKTKLFIISVFRIIFWIIILNILIDIFNIDTVSPILYYLNIIIIIINIISMTIVMSKKNV